MKHNWEYKRLGDVCDIIGGSTPKTEISEYWEGEYNWFTPAEINNRKYYDVSERKITAKGAESASLTLMPKGTVLLTSRAPIGKVGITTVEAYCNQGFKNLVCKSQLYNEYLYYTLIYFNEDIKDKGRGATFKEISKSVTATIQIPVPPMEVQEQIVAELDKINELIADHREMLTQLDALAQSLFYDTFGDPITNPKGWGMKSIDKICSSIVRGPFGGALKKEIFIEKSSDSYKVYEQKHAIKKDASIGSYYISNRDYIRLNRFKLTSGDIIMSCSGTIGEFYQLPDGCEQGVMNQALLKYRLNDEIITSRYFLWLMNDIKRLFTVYGTGLQNISSVATIKSLQIPLPPLALQESFARKIEAIEAQKADIEASIAELQTLLDSRMNYWFN